jgi:hypothetical protein
MPVYQVVFRREVVERVTRTEELCVTAISPDERTAVDAATRHALFDEKHWTGAWVEQQPTVERTISTVPEFVRVDECPDPECLDSEPVIRVGEG